MACEKIKDAKAKKKCLEANKQLENFKKNSYYSSMPGVLNRSRKNESIPMKNRSIEVVTDKMARQAGAEIKPKSNK